MTFPASILIVDDEKRSLDLLESFLAPKGYRVLTAKNGQEAIQVVKNENIDLMILDIVMPVLSGIEVCKTLKKDSEFQLIPIILISALDGPQIRIEGIDVGALEFIKKPIDMNALLVRVKSSLKVKSLTDNLESAEKVLIALAGAVEARDEYTGGHVNRVTYVAMALGKRLDLEPEVIEDIRKGGKLHDVGKIGIPDNILQKPGKLTPDEYERIKEHSQIGYELCRKLKTIGNGLELILTHHEKLDGSGYPNGLCNGEISLSSRILTFSDIYDALTSSRCYRAPLNLEKSFEILADQVKDNKLDAEVFTAFRELNELGALPA